MPFYTPTDSRFTRHYREEVDIALSAMDCVLCRERAIYASTELTTGVRLYEALRKTGTLTAAALREKIGRESFTSLEFAVAVDAGLPTSDCQGQPLSVEIAMDLIRHAIAVLDADGFDTSALRLNLERVSSRRQTRTVVER